MLRQVIGVCVVAGYSAFATATILKIIDLIVGIRVDIQDEVEGLDASVHGEKVFYGDNEGARGTHLEPAAPKRSFLSA